MCALTSDWYVSISMQYNKHCCDYMRSRYLGQCMRLQQQYSKPGFLATISLLSRKCVRMFLLNALSLSLFLFLTTLLHTVFCLDFQTAGIIACSEWNWPWAYLYIYTWFGMLATAALLCSACLHLIILSSVHIKIKIIFNFFPLLWLHLTFSLRSRFSCSCCLSVCSLVMSMSVPFFFSRFTFSSILRFFLHAFDWLVSFW